MAKQAIDATEPTENSIPTAPDYDPTVIGTADLSAGTSAQVWEDYGLELVPVKLNGQDTSRRLILRNGQYIADVSNQYKLLPNERAVAAADAVADELGAVPFDDFSGDWYIPLDDHVVMDDEGRRVHALYAFEEPVTLPNGDEIQTGFAVHNSIDASLGFHVGLFTFRHACQNMVWMGVGDEGMNFDDREVLVNEGRKHTKGLGVDHDALRARVKNVLLLSDDVTDAYEAWLDQFVTESHIEEMLRRLPEKDLPAWVENIGEVLDRADENGTLGGGNITREDLIRAEMPATETVWSTYNDLTESVWHDPDTSDRTKTKKMKDIHRVFKPAAAVQ